MAIPNPITALVAYLQADSDVSDQVGTKVYGAELPAAQTANMPQKCMVVAGAGGPGGGFGDGRMPLNTIRVDLKGYGTTLANSWDVYHAGYNALKQMTRAQQGTVLLYDARVAGGPLQLRDGDLDWPLVYGSFLITVSEIAV